MEENQILDIILDLEFLGTEEDMVSEYPGEDAFPIVTSIGIVAKLDGKTVASKNMALNFKEQLDSGAKFGKGCMLQFWTKQPLLGEELARTMSQEEPVLMTLTNIAMLINSLRSTLAPKQINIWGNNLLADNGKVIRLFAKYTNLDRMPWSYWENRDYREYIKTAEFLGFDRKGSERDFERAVGSGLLITEGFTAAKLHNAEYDCHKQFWVLEHARTFLESIKSGLVEDIQ